MRASVIGGGLKIRLAGSMDAPYRHELAPGDVVEVLDYRPDDPISGELRKRWYNIKVISTRPPTENGTFGYVWGPFLRIIGEPIHDHPPPLQPSPPSPPPPPPPAGPVVLDRDPYHPPWPWEDHPSLWERIMAAIRRLWRIISGRET